METYHGHVRTPQDAIVLFEACRVGMLPRVQRRLSEKERSQIKSGSVFVWDEREAGMRRWTDGKSWSASRVSGSFLTYREMEGKRGSNGFQPAGPRPIRAKSDGPASASASNAGDSDEGDEGPDGYRYKPDGLMKQSFSITTQDGRHLHLISYYNRSQVPPLKTPTSDPQLRNIQPPKGMYPENTVNEPTTIAPVAGRPPLTNAPYAAHPSPGLVIAYPWGQLAHYPPPHGMAYPPAWPPSPSATPPHHYAYPTHYAHSPYGHPHLPPFPHHAAHPPPPTPQPGLPPPQASTNGHSPGSWPVRSPGAPPYYPTGQPSPYAASQPPAVSTPSSAPAPASVAPASAGYQKPLTPPATNGTQAPAKPYTEPPPIKEVPGSGGNSPKNKIIPSINALINGPSEKSPTTLESGSKSPVRVSIKDVPNAMMATGMQRDRGDLKKLDSQLLKGKS